MHGKTLCQCGTDLAPPVQDFRGESLIPHDGPNVFVAEASILHERFQRFMWRNRGQGMVFIFKILDDDGQQLGKRLLLGSEVFPFIHF